MEKPDVYLSWIINSDGRKEDLESEVCKKELLNAIIMLLRQGCDIRICSDGYCAILEANRAADGNYEWVDMDHYVEEFSKE